MGNSKQIIASRQTKSVTYLGIVINVVLTVVKVVIGLLSGSLALLKSLTRATPTAMGERKLSQPVWLR
jgi:divalent metal cation (Fe/Co/Zn/Cd) transporter